jgi:hypothetical protein
MMAMDMHCCCTVADGLVEHKDCHSCQMRALLEAFEDIVVSQP